MSEELPDEMDHALVCQLCGTDDCPRLDAIHARAEQAEYERDQLRAWLIKARWIPSRSTTKVSDFEQGQASRAQEKVESYQEVQHSILAPNAASTEGCAMSEKPPAKIAEKSPAEQWTAYARTWLAGEGEKGAIMNLAIHVGLLSKRLKDAERKIKRLEKIEMCREACVDPFTGKGTKAEGK